MYLLKVTNLRERGREQCIKYWPDEDEPPLVFRTLEVTPVDSAYYADYTVSILHLSLKVAFSCLGSSL